MKKKPPSIWFHSAWKRWVCTNPSWTIRLLYWSTKNCWHVYNIQCRIIYSKMIWHRITAHMWGCYHGVEKQEVDKGRYWQWLNYSHKKYDASKLNQPVCMLCYLASCVMGCKELWMCLDEKVDLFKQDKWHRFFLKHLSVNLIIMSIGCSPIQRTWFQISYACITELINTNYLGIFYHDTTIINACTEIMGKKKNTEFFLAIITMSPNMLFYQKSHTINCRCSIWKILLFFVFKACQEWDDYYY